MQLDFKEPCRVIFAAFCFYESEFWRAYDEVIEQKLPGGDMSDEKDVVPAQPKTNEKEEGFFTGKLQWWQILLGLIFVGYLVYGKYEENVARSNNPPVSAPAPGK